MWVQLTINLNLNFEFELVHYWSYYMYVSDLKLLVSYFNFLYNVYLSLLKCTQLCVALCHLACFFLITIWMAIFGDKSTNFIDLGCQNLIETTLYTYITNAMSHLLFVNHKMIDCPIFCFIYKQSHNSQIYVIVGQYKLVVNKCS